MPQAQQRSRRGQGSRLPATNLEWSHFAFVHRLTELLTQRVAWSERVPPRRTHDMNAGPVSRDACGPVCGYNGFTSIVVSGGAVRLGIKPYTALRVCGPALPELSEYPATDPCSRRWCSVEKSPQPIDVLEYDIEA
eukprot:6116765-Prymnesium_polylepis.1